MKGRSLWSALMLAWLSATNTPSLPGEAAPSDISLSDADADAGREVALPAGSAKDDVGATAPATAPRKPEF
jgi:hypothetical protein